jgi:hypothetical protein
MFRKLVKATEIEVDGIGYALRFYELKTIRGGLRFSCEVLLDAADRIILDDDSMPSLESKVERLAPATVYSRALAGRRSVAA